VTATAGAARIGALVLQAAGRIAIMPGSGVTADHAKALIGLGVRELHGSCSVSVPLRGPGVGFGFGPEVERRTEAGLVRAVKRAMEEEQQWTSP
jgi:copper homeostasis protein